MSEIIEVIGKPDIVVSDVDHWRLSNLAVAVRHRFPDVAEELQQEMVRASIAEAGTIAPDVVTMGSIVEFRKGAEEPRRIELVFPGDADIARGRISILTPIGAALIGLSVGQSTGLRARDGRPQELTVLAVEQPAGV